MPIENIFSEKNHNRFILDHYAFPNKIIEFQQQAVNHIIGLPIKGQTVVTSTLNDEALCNKETMKGGDIVLIPNMREISWCSKPINKAESNFECITLYLSVIKFNQVLLETFDRDPVSIELLPKFAAQDGLIREIVLNIYRQYKQENYFGVAYIDGLVNTMILHLLSHYCSATCRVKNPKGKLSPVILRKICEYVEENYRKNISLDELASLACMSKYHFSRLFEQSMGIAPHKYLMMYRIEKAKHLLISTTLNIEAIALDVGYESVNHFRNIFRRFVGVNPKTYRNS
ncbi:MAG: AraC family transcriptional regulator [Pseudomonadota bacterium]